MRRRKVSRDFPTRGTTCSDRGMHVGQRRVEVPLVVSVMSCQTVKHLELKIRDYFSGPVLVGKPAQICTVSFLQQLKISISLCF